MEQPDLMGAQPAAGPLPPFAGVPALNPHEETSEPHEEAVERPHFVLFEGLGGRELNRVAGYFELGDLDESAKLSVRLASFLVKELKAGSKILLEHKDGTRFELKFRTEE